MNIGLIGFGGVGKALIKLFIDKKHKISEDICLKYIINSKGGLYNREGIDLKSVIDKLENIESHKDWIDNLTIDDIIKNKDINYLVELTSTNIQTGEPGLTHIKKSLENGINVITGNKGPILISYNELMNIASNNNVSLKIGCTTGGALPSINGGIIECAGSDILEIQGILNGTTNFILSMMSDTKLNYKEALKIAQEEGIAELDPKLDVEGFDTAIKMIILSNSIFKTNFKIEDVSVDGITGISEKDIYQNDKKLKLIGKAYKCNNKVEIKVQLEAIDKSHPLYSVDYKNKGILYKTDTLGDICIIGGASGTINAAASIYRDLINLNKAENM